MATCLIHIRHLFPVSSDFPSLSAVTSFFTTRVTPRENVTEAILSYAVLHLPEFTGKLRKTGEVQNLVWSNVERPILRNFKIANIKIAKDELVDYFI